MTHRVQVIRVNTLVDNEIENIRLDDVKTYVHRRKGPAPGTSGNGNKHAVGSSGGGGDTLNARKRGNNVNVLSHSEIEMPIKENDRWTTEDVTGHPGNVFIVAGSPGLFQHEQQNSENLAVDNPGGRIGELAIQIEPELESTETPVNVLRSFLCLMYWIGLSTYDPRFDHNGFGGYRKSRCNIFFQILFCVVGLVGFIHSLHITKYNCIVFVAAGGMTNFVDAGYCIVPILADIYITRLFALQHGRLKRMLSCLERLFKSANDEIQQKLMRRTMKFLVATTIIICVLESSSDVPLIGWSLENVILSQSAQLSYGLFIWKPNDVTDASTVRMDLEEKYGGHLSQTTLIMGLTAGAMKFCSSMKMEIVIDLVILTGWCFKECIRMQAAKLRNINFSTYGNGDDCAELDSSTGDWAHYKNLKAANKAINAVFDGILKLMHIQNTMICAVFLMHLLQNDLSCIQLLLLIHSIFKIFVAYQIAKKSHGYNSVFQQWIRDWAMHSRDPVFHGRVPAILDEMRAEPLGLGSGEFIIGEGFILKFMGMVTSLFVLQVDNATEE